jgi:sec-independent protein translocase protein TatC
MSSVIDEDTANTINTGRAAVGSGLRAVQENLQTVFIVFVVGMLGSILAMRWYVWDFLKQTATAQIGTNDPAAGQVEIIAQTPFDVILLQVKVGALIGGLMAAVALLVVSRHVIARKVTPAAPVTKTQLYAFIAFAVFLFFAGMIYAYFLFFPFMFAFLANNAVKAAIQPKYGIVEFTEFMILLTVSFGLAAQLPLFVSGLSYTEILPYEFFRDKWRYAVLLIFVFGMVASPPDPFTQVMWGLPLCGLYAFSLGLAKAVTNIRRGADQGPGALTRKFKQLAVVAGVAWLAGFLFVVADGLAAFNESVRPSLPASVQPDPLTVAGLAPAEGTLGAAYLGLVVAAAVSAVVVGVFLVVVLRRPVVPRDLANTGDPEEIDLSALDEEAIHAAPEEAFLALSEDEALELAREAMNEDDADRAEAILDRFDSAQAAAEEAAEDAAEEGEDADATDEEEGDVVTETAAGMVDPFTEDETTEEDIGGYLYDIRFILESLTSRLFRIVGVFMLATFATFGWLYSGGIGDIFDQFISRIPDDVLTAESGSGGATGGGDGGAGGAVDFSSVGDVGVIALHPVEALIFEVKVSVIVGVIAVLPLILYYVWPALEERGLARGDRRVFGLWGLFLFAGFVVGSVLGFYFVAPAIISFLVGDALAAGMKIAYRLKNFFWLVFLLTAGIGILFDLILTMVLFHLGGIVSFETMYRRWRPIVFAMFTAAMFLTPDSVLTMLVVSIPAVGAFLLGLAILWLLTFPSRAGRRWRGAGS